MAIRDYKELRAIIADWMDRRELAGTVPSVVEGVTVNLANIFCTRVEGDVNRRLRVEDMATILFNTAQEGQSMIVLPDNVLGLRLVTVDGVDAEYVTPEQYSRASRFYCGAPLYTRMAGQLHFYPNFADKCEVIVVAYCALKPLVNDGDTNWMLDKYPDVYLSGCLYEACAYIRDDEGQMQWKQKFDIAIQEISDADSNDRWSGSTLGIRNV